MTIIREQRIRTRPQETEAGASQGEETMMTYERLNLRQTADVLALDRLRLFRLGRHLRLTPGDPCIPLSVIARARAEDDEEGRYRVVLDWLLGHSEVNGSAALAGSRAN